MQFSKKSSLPDNISLTTKLIFDADALIKLCQISLLASVCEHFPAVTTRQIKDEVIPPGKKRPMDAEKIESLFQQGCLRLEKSRDPFSYYTIEQGEWSLVAVYGKNSLIISDDLAFTREIVKQKIATVDCAELVVVLTKLEILSWEQAQHYLSLLQMCISRESYQRAQWLLEGNDD